MAPNVSVVNSDANNNATIVQFNSVPQLPIKLAGTHNIYGHLDVSIPAPLHTLSQNNQHIKNPTFLVWFCQDQLIQNAILAFFEPTLSATIAVADSAKVALDTLHSSYANKSQTRIISLRDQLARVTKDTRPVADYFHQVRSLCDELATAREPVSNPELIVKVLSRVGSEFRELSVVIRARDSTISYEEL
ncbi:hypothetical protein KY285_030401 [Solanum tuberosum]|nr:hypothetical protein KY285_030401 [Solanum tuberosum]